MFGMIFGALVLSSSFIAQDIRSGWLAPFPGVQRPQSIPYHAGINADYPKLLRKVEPTPSHSGKGRIRSGTVVLELIINEKGEVWQVRVLDGPLSLIDAALDAVRQWRYAPTIVDGLPSPVITTAKVRVVVQDEEPANCGAAAPRLEPIPTGGNVQESKLLRKAEPIYPKEFRGRGTILLQVTVNEQGDVYEVRILRCPSIMEKAVLAAVCRWKYSPTFLNGAPVPVISTAAIEFNLPVSESGRGDERDDSTRH